MKKNFIRNVAVMGLLIVSSLTMSAQEKTYECQPLNPELQTMADKVMEFALEDPEKADREFTKLTKKASKSADDLLSLGDYFLQKDYLQGAMICSKYVYEKNAADYDVLMFCGEVRMKMQDWGNAGSKFDEILSYDPNNVTAMKRRAFVYKNINPIAATEDLLRIIELEPDYYKAYKDLGDIYYKQDKYVEACSYYKDYYKAVPKDIAHIDIRSCENYLQSLYSQAQFDSIIIVAKEIQPLDPMDIVIRRMDFFAKINKIQEAFDYDKALAEAQAAGNYIYNKEYADSIYLYLDYEYAAALEKEKGDIPAAITYYEKALAKDSTKLGGYKELSNLCIRNKQYDKGIEAYNIYLQKRGDKVDTADRFLLATKYVYACLDETTTPEKKNDYRAKAEATFKEVIDKKPDFVQAYIQLARLNNTDTQKPIAAVRDYYNKVLEVSESKADEFAAQRFEACRYIFFYDVSIEPEDFEDAKRICAILKSIRPDDEFVKNAEQFLQQNAQ